MPGQSDREDVRVQKTGEEENQEEERRVHGTQ